MTPAKARGPVAHPPEGRGRVLVVEDSPHLQELVAAVLIRDGYEVGTAADGVEGVSAAQSGGFDLILMDMQMPRLDGVAASAAIRALPGKAGQVPILALSAHAQPMQIAAMLQAGIDAHLAKPFAVDELSRRVRELLAATGVLPAPAAEPDPAAGLAAGLVDMAGFAALVGLLGPEALRARLRDLSGQMDLPARTTPEALRRAAHRLVSDAGQFGLAALARDAAAVEAALTRNADPAPALVELAVTVAQTRAVLPGLLARLDGAQKAPAPRRPEPDLGHMA